MKSFAICAALIILSSSISAGQSYKILYSFQGQLSLDGSQPLGALARDNAGNLYGTTKIGGTNGLGTIFELSPNSDGSWTESTLYSFCSTDDPCADGSEPQAALGIDSQGNLYGTTSAGGSQAGHCNFGGCGTVFELSPPAAPGGTWTETILYDFCAGGSPCSDGAIPLSALAVDASGNLYGTTSAGGSGSGGHGAGQNGVVFELSSGSGAWTYSVLYNFCPSGQGRFCPDGSLPGAGVIVDKSGNLYGTTQGGGAQNSGGGGTVYKLSPGSGEWTHSVLKAFVPLATGGGPRGEVRMDNLGNLYSTLFAGGEFGSGAVFKLESAGKGAEFFFDGNNGSLPTAGITLDFQNRALYGTTSLGGANQAGTVYKITATGQQSVLYSFCQPAACADGSSPLSELIQDASGNLYGTTMAGGTTGNGVVFEVTP